MAADEITYRVPWDEVADRFAPQDEIGASSDDHYGSMDMPERKTPLAIAGAIARAQARAAWYRRHAKRCLGERCPHCGSLGRAA